VGEQLRHRHPPQARQRRGRVGAAQLGCHGGAEGLHLPRRPPSVPGDRGQSGEDAARRQVHQGKATLDNRPVEQARRPGRDQVGAGGQPAVGLAEHRHVAGVAPERGGVAGHPAQRGLLVLEAEGPRIVQPGMAEGSEDPQPVVDRHHHHHHHHVPDGGEPAAVEEAAGPDGAVAVDPHQHRPWLLRVGGPRDDDVQAQTVLGQAGHLGIGGGLLGAHVARPGGVCHLGPRAHRLGSPPAQLARRRRGIGDPLEQPVVVGHGAAYRTRIGLHDRRISHLAAPFRPGSTGSRRWQSTDAIPQDAPAQSAGRLDGRKPLPLPSQIRPPTSPRRGCGWS
jgi:hypothetical protein